jgi:hypothetical protein
MDFLQAARNNVDSHIGDVMTADMMEEGEEGMDLFYAEVYTLAFDGAKDAGATMEQAGQAAAKVQYEY